MTCEGREEALEKLVERGKSGNVTNTVLMNENFKKSQNLRTLHGKLLELT